MINMMYLVLTAMLALNVSWEVLQAFVNMEEGFQQTMRIVREDNHKAFLRFREIAKEQPLKADSLMQLAAKVKERTEILYRFIDSLKLEIVHKSEGDKSKAIIDGEIRAKLIENLDDTDSGSRVLVGSEESKGAAYELKDRIDSHREFLLSFATSPDPKDSILRAIITGLLDTERKNTEGTVKTKTAQGGVEKDWAHLMFDNTPIISSIALLSTLQMNILNSESSMFNYFLSKVGEEDFKFSKVQVIVRSNTDYVVKGSEYKAEIFLAAYNDNDDSGMILNINGREYKPGTDGKIHFTGPSSTAGPMSIGGTLKYRQPDGQITEEPLRIIYQVIEPVATVSPSKMNVLYAGVENPLDISVGAGVSIDKIRAEINGTPIQRKGNSFVVTPSASLKTVDIAVSAEINGEWKNMGTSKFRIKQVPIPSPVLDGVTGRTATKNELSASQGLIARMPSDFEFDLKMTVVSFTVSTVSNDGYTRDETSNSAQFTQAQYGLFKNLRANSQVVFTNIKAKNSTTGAIVELNDLVIKIK